MLGKIKIRKVVAKKVLELLKIQREKLELKS